MEIFFGSSFTNREISQQDFLNLLFFTAVEKSNKIALIIDLKKKTNVYMNGNDSPEVNFQPLPQTKKGRAPSPRRKSSPGVNLNFFSKKMGKFLLRRRESYLTLSPTARGNPIGL